VWQVLDVKLPFDEEQLLKDNLEYLLRSLGLQGLTIGSTDAPGAVEAAQAAGVGLSAACPGQPVTFFSAAGPAGS
jgi:hypothetical protein